MAQTSSTVRLIFDGSERGVVAAAAKASAAIRGLNDDHSRLSKTADKASSALLGIGKGMLALSAANTAVKTISGVAGAVQQLAPAALLLPGALLSGAAAMATFKIATAGVGDALKAGLSGDMEKFAKATKNMAPAMQDAVKAVVAFKPQIDDLKHTVQGNFWAGFNVGIKQLGDQYLPVLQRRLPDIASQFNLIGRGIVEAFSSRDTLSDFDSLLGNVAASMTGLGPAVGNVGAGIVKLAELGSRRFAGLGEAVDKVAEKFRTWVAQGVESGQLDRLLSDAIAGFKDLAGIVKNVGSILGSVFTGLGGQIESPLARIRELTGQVAEFLKTASAQEGLKALGETLQVVGDVVGRVVMTAFRELAPTLVALAPAAQEIARTLGDLLVNSLETLGPVVRGVAGVLGEFPGVVGLATTAVVGFVAAVKTIKAVNAVTEFLGIGAAIGGVGDKAKAADGKVAPLVTRLGAFKAIGAAAALAAVAVAMDDINSKSAGGAQNLQGVEENLHDIVGAGQQLASLDFVGIFRDINSELTQWRQNIQSGQGAFGQFLGSIKRQLAEPLPPMTVDVDTGPGERQLSTFIRAVNGQTALVNINGNPNGAAFALREIIAEINQGKGEVIIDGQPMKAQDALNYVIGLINNSNPEVLINGNPQPAGDALAGFLRDAQGSTATANLNANPALAYETVNGWTRAAEGTVGIANLDANPAPANGQVSNWVGGVSRTRGTATLDANPGPANTQLGGWKGRADTTTGTSRLDANPGLANGKVTEWKGTADRAVGTARLNADDSGARGTLSGLLRDWGSRVLTWTVRMITGAAGGGPVVAGRAGGGPVRGPGTGTSDTAGLYALSNGEHILTAREVAAAGGHAAIFALRRSLTRGRVPRMAATRGHAAAGGSVTSAGALSMPTPQVSVAVHIGSREITDIVRTEITTASRATRRTVLAGAGTTF